jgi:sugar lactone lactonase YvrE
MPVYSIDEYHQRVVRSDLSAQGFLENNEVLIERGDRGIATDSRGNVYVSSGDVLVFDSQGNRIGTIEVPERAASLLISGDVLYITAITSLYQVRL